jgi:glycerophosphoryl diester phosphodiesterase
MSNIHLSAFLAAMCALSSPASGQLIVAHRGASHDAPENTIAAYRLAIEQGADAFEGDFWLGAGGHILDLHDKDTKRVAGKKFSITKAPFAKLRTLDVGSWNKKNKKANRPGERIPTLEEVLAIVPADKKVFLELKSGPEIVKPMAKVIAASKVPREQIVLIGFNADAVAACKKQMPDIKALWLCSFNNKKREAPPKTPAEVAATLKRIHADGLDAQAVPEYFNAAFINCLRKLGCHEFSVWTVDDPKVAKFYADLGAWSITTNRPAWLREKMKK